MKTRKTLKDLVKPIDPKNPFNQPQHTNEVSHTPTPLEYLDGTKISTHELMFDLGVSLSKAREIIRAVNEYELNQNALKSALADSARFALETKHLKDAHEELIEALKAIYDVTSVSDKTSKALKLVYDAIARAEGK